MPRSVDDANTIQGISVSKNATPNYLYPLGSNAKFSSYAIFKNIITVTADYSPGTNDYTLLCDATSVSFTVYLQTSVGILGKIYFVKKVDSTANTITIQPSGTETIQGATSLTLATQGDIYILQSDGSNWSIIGFPPSAGTGNMSTIVYDPAAIDQQLLGISAVQTVDNKIIDGGTW